VAVEMKQAERAQAAATLAAMNKVKLPRHLQRGINTADAAR